MRFPPPHMLAGAFVAAILLAWIAPDPVRARPAPLCYAGPDQTICVAEAFRAFWHQRGGVDVLGRPTTAAHTEQTPAGTETVQYFERARLARRSNGSVGATMLDDAASVVLNRSTTAALDQFWRAAFAARGWRYHAPRAVIFVRSPTTPVCGTATISANTGPFFCVAADVIYVDRAFLHEAWQAWGDMVIVTTVAHEWGHHLQLLRGVDDRYSRRQRETQADCYAGAYLGALATQGTIDHADLATARTFLRSIGDRRPDAAYNPRSHGTPEQRVQTFEQGVSGGVDTCDRLLPVPLADDAAADQTHALTYPQRQIGRRARGW